MNATLASSVSDSTAGAPLSECASQLAALRQEIEALEGRFAAQLGAVHPDQRAGALNLVHYVALRGRDLRPLQERLASLGLSSLGRAEIGVVGNLDAVSRAVACLSGQASQPTDWDTYTQERKQARALLEEHTRQLLGQRPARRVVRIMVTLPTEAAQDYALVEALLSEGMDCARINCAHDDADAWSRMIRNIRRAEAATGRHCRIEMDLGGPKLRTGEIEPGPQVMKWQPQRDDYGRPTIAARVRLVSEDFNWQEIQAQGPFLTLPGPFRARLRPGDKLDFHDARAASRVLAVTECAPETCWAESDDTCYVTPGTLVHLHRRGEPEEAAVGALPLVQRAIDLFRGDRLLLTRDPAPGCLAERDSAGRALAPARIPCSLPQIFEDVKAGERVWLDDGKIGGVIRSVSRERIDVEITHARDEGERLLSDKGINLPDSELHSPALTDKDIRDLEFVARHADMVALSFVRKVSDVRALQQQLARLGRPDLGIVLKIETRAAFERLPELLLSAMASPHVGVMIARGDLAVECGYERLAELQEEILWLCEAARTPVIWATQVLEGLAKKGQPSRAEITDAAMGERAECVMLNKGPHIVEAIQTLNGILRRMQEHQRKKSSMLRRLQSWSRVELG
ncbi:MAG TPA: pyruvate kinase [Burkholderiales bacterium]|nr:pyruvate kinase [Burkholderiales bacterium]